MFKKLYRRFYREGMVRFEGNQIVCVHEYCSTNTQ